MRDHSAPPGLKVSQLPSRLSARERSGSLVVFNTQKSLLLMKSPLIHIGCMEQRENGEDNHPPCLDAAVARKVLSRVSLSRVLTSTHVPSFWHPDTAAASLKTWGLDIGKAHSNACNADAECSLRVRECTSVQAACYKTRLVCF